VVPVPEALRDEAKRAQASDPAAPDAQRDHVADAHARPGDAAAGLDAPPGAAETAAAAAPPAITQKSLADFLDDDNASDALSALREYRESVAPPRPSLAPSSRRQQPRMVAYLVLAAGLAVAVWYGWQAVAQPPVVPTTAPEPAPAPIQTSTPPETTSGVAATASTPSAAPATAPALTTASETATQAAPVPAPLPSVMLPPRPYVPRPTSAPKQPPSGALPSSTPPAPTEKPPPGQDFSWEDVDI
jgi:hypothetical protein